MMIHRVFVTYGHQSKECPPEYYYQDLTSKVTTCDDLQKPPFRRPVGFGAGSSFEVAFIAMASTEHGVRTPRP